MSYITIKTMSIDTSNLSIKTKASPSNIRDWNDRAIVDENIAVYDTQEEFEEALISIANEYLSGYYRMSRSMTIPKRIAWLIDNGYAYNLTERWLKLTDCEVTRQVLTGKKKIKADEYIFTNGYLEARVTKRGCSLKSNNSKKSKATKLYKYEAEMVEKENQKFFEKYHVKCVKVA